LDELTLNRPEQVYKLLRKEDKMNLNQFIGHSQLLAIKSACKGEEGEYFYKKITDLKTQILAMPKTYETDGQGNEALATLHYFNSNSDWYIIEKDMEEQQIQAFGFTRLNGDSQNAELGYINIEELIQYGVELDLYYTPEKIGDIKARFLKSA